MGLFDRVVSDAKQKSGGQLIEEDLMTSVNDLEGEEWRDIAGFEDSYEVSNLGRVRSKKRTLSTGRVTTCRILKYKGHPYGAVMLFENNVGTNKLVHRLVAEAFIPNPDNMPEVNHKDSNPSNNKVSNLEWVSSADNTKHRVVNKSNYKYRKAVKCLETGEIFESISAAGRFVSASTQQVIDSINSKGCCKGFTFVYNDAIPEDPEEYMKVAHARYQNFHRRPNMKNARKVLAVETGQEFDSMGAAARFFDCDTATIRNRVKAAKPFNGMTLKFIEEEEEKQ